MHKVLIISDNADLSEYILNIYKSSVNSVQIKLDLCYSANNRQPSAMIKIGANPIDVKNADEVERIIKSYNLVISLHCKQIFPKKLVESITCLNFHPGLNPYNRGWYPQVFSIINQLPAGATLHHMDAEIDHGAIIDQIEVPVGPADTSLDIYNRVISAEKQLIDRQFSAILNRDYVVKKPSIEGNYNSIDDFKSICHLDLNNVATLKSHLNLLRALTHGNFKNAFFEDEYGKKFFVRITIEES